MTMMPNELVTQREPIKRARGNVATYGLGLGYFAFMCARKDEVESVTIVERDENVISLFNELLLPMFENREKVKIVRADAFEFAENEAPKGGFDYIFADIWHDPSDGVDAYKRFKSLEHLCPNTKFDYWIEKTLKLYM
jgi:spermidine synthase